MLALLAGRSEGIANPELCVTRYKRLLRVICAFGGLPRRRWLRQVAVKEIEDSLPAIHRGFLSIAGAVVSEEAVASVRRIRFELIFLVIFFYLFLQPSYVLGGRVRVRFPE